MAELTESQKLQLRLLASTAEKEKLTGQLWSHDFRCPDFPNPQVVCGVLAIRYIRTQEAMTRIEEHRGHQTWLASFPPEVGDLCGKER